jgi:hypothetical protein
MPTLENISLKAIFARTLIFGLVGVSCAAAQDVTATAPGTPAEQFRAIVGKYHEASTGGAASDDERRKVIARVDAMRDGLSREFLALAENHPADAIAVDALIQAVWMVNHNGFPTGGKDAPGLTAMRLLLRDHISSGKLGPICLRISSGFRVEHESFLRAVLDASPHRSARALACLALGQFLKDRSQRLDQIGDQPSLAAEYKAVFGRNYLDELRKLDRSAVAREIEGLFERAGREFGDEPIPFAGSVGEKAKAELFEFRHLLVGREAPDIEGEDQNGRRFKLSDYRGKVVLLDFWHHF